MMRMTLPIALVALMASSAATVLAEHQELVIVEQSSVEQLELTTHGTTFVLAATPAMDASAVAPGCCDQGYETQRTLSAGCCDQGYETGRTKAPAFVALALLLMATLYYSSTFKRSWTSWT